MYLRLIIKATRLSQAIVVRPDRGNNKASRKSSQAIFRSLDRVGLGGRAEWGGPEGDALER